MTDEEMQRLWQSQRTPGAGAREMAGLLATAREQHRKLRRTIFWRDVRELAVAAVMLPVWCWLGVRHHEGWLWYVMIPVLLFVAGVLVASRWEQRRDEPRPGDSVAEGLEKALREVERQIGLLRTVLWWYIGPIVAVLIAIDVDRWMRGAIGAGVLARGITVDVVIGGAIWWVNLYAVRKGLEPRRREILRMMEEVGNDE
jgi:hypothetical protein